MHHNPDIIKRYLNPGFSVVDSHFDMRLPGKLAPFREEVKELRTKRYTYPKIKAIIDEKGYTGSEAALRMMMQKEWMYAKFSYMNEEKKSVEYVQRNALCRTVYVRPEEVAIITKEQYMAVLKKYPTLQTVFEAISEFKRIIFSKKSGEIERWISDISLLNITELNTFVEGLKRDIVAIKNGIENQYSNGLAEGSDNKIKVIKRITYDRNSFELLRTKTLFREQNYG